MEKSIENMSLVDQLYTIKNGLKNELKVLGYANNTISLYMREIDHFINFCTEFDGEITYKQITRPLILQAIEYRDKISPKGKISANTKEIFIKSLKSFFKYIEEEIDPYTEYTKMFDKIKIRKEKKETKYLNDDEIRRLINTLEREKRLNSYTRFRNVFLTKLLLYGGLRISEALNLKFSDFEDANDGSVYRIRILGKGNKEASVFINKKAIQDEYEELYEKRNRQDGYVFITRSGRVMSRIEAKSVVDRFYILSGIQKRGLHLLRHTLAMKLVREGVDIIHIQKILRHSNISTTTIYAHSTEEDMVKIAKKEASLT